MKNILMLLLVAFVSHAQIKKEQLDLMPWPNNINLNKGVFTLTKSFKINITGDPKSRIFVGATRFLRRLDGRTGLFLEQGFVTNTNEFPSAELQINCQRSGVLGLNEDENYVLEVEPNIIRINATNAPLVQALLPLSQSLSDISVQILLGLEKRKTDSSVLSNLLEECNAKNYADV